MKSAFDALLDVVRPSKPETVTTPIEDVLAKAKQILLVSDLAEIAGGESFTLTLMQATQSCPCSGPKTIVGLMEFEDESIEFVTYCAACGDTVRKALDQRQDAQ